MPTKYGNHTKKELQQLFNYFREQSETLKEHNEELKKENEIIGKKLGLMRDKYEILYQENEQLRDNITFLQCGEYNLNILINNLDKDTDQDVYEGISFPHPNPEKEGAEMMLMYKNKMNKTLKCYPSRQMLKEENKELKEVINSSKEWLELCQDNDGNIKNYDLRQLDTRIRPEKYMKA